ncbi:fatty acid-binding protein [mine drainage metagenome]|uniref:Fatty acid-binding protein n=1 Tax=mine drainage metagenome TaxID=410659 RepID=A0A1J5PUA5_9ZZZZ
MPIRAIDIVTDSTAYLPVERARELEITVVPLQVMIGGESYPEGGEGAEVVLAALRSGAVATTSQPSPETFLEVYRKSAELGFEGIVSIHLSSSLSGTYESAVLAAAQSPIPVRVIDSRSVAMGLGFAAISAALAADEGAPIDEVAEVARLRAAATRTFFTTPNLDQLRRSGRVSRGAALLANALNVLPILSVEKGEVVALEKVRTTARALARVEELAAECAHNGTVDIAVHHLGAPDLADEVAARLQKSIKQIGEVVMSELGAVIGAHAGPGTLAVIVAPRI